MPLVGEIAVGVASNLVFESLKRPFDALSAEVRRRDQIGRALNDRATARAAKERLVLGKVSADLARVIGSGEGKLTAPVVDFIREFRRTAIPESIAHAALCGSDPSSLRASFQLFYERFSDLPFTGDQLFNAFFEACKARIEDVDDPALLDIIRAQHSDLTTKLEYIAQSIHNSLAEGKEYSVSAIRDARLKIARSIEMDAKFVSVETLQGSKKFKLASLAIPGRLATLSDSDIQTAKMPLNAPTMAFLPFRRQFDRAVIVGDPGGGKSTLTQMLSAEQAALVLLEAANPERREFEQRDLKMPLKIILRRYEARNIQNPAYSFFDHLRDDLRVALEGDEPLAHAYLSSALGLGEAIIIFDGLDEVLDVGARRRIAEQIEQFSQIYSACPVLVTSRLVGYRDAPLNNEFCVFGLSRFNTEEVAKYSEKAISAVGQIKRAEARRKAQEFILQTDRVGSDLRENPLLLGLMVQIFVYRGDVPNNRPEVYRECATLMFEKWDGRREILADVPRHDVELLDVFGYVASRTFGDARTEEGVSREWLVKELRNHFEGWYVDRASANRAANSLVDFLTGRAWVMSEVGQGTYKFTHRTFLEYFFARNLISESRGIDELIRIDLIPRVVENQWSVIAHLALHMAVFRDGGKSRQAAETFERLLADEQFPAAQELAFLNFITSALPYLTIPESAYLRIVESTLTRAVELGAHEDVAAIAVIEQLATGVPQRENLAQEKISVQLQKCLEGTELPKLVFAMYATGGRRPRYRRTTQYRHSPRVTNQPPSRLRSLIDLNKKKLLEIALNHVEVAQAYIYLYGEARAALYRVHGMHLLQTSASKIVPPELEQVLAEAVAVVIDRDNSADLLKIEDCNEFLSAVTREVMTGGLELSRLLSPGKNKLSTHEWHPEELFHSLWVKAQRGRRNMLSESFSNALVCIVSASEINLDELRSNDRIRIHGSYGGLLAPKHVVREFIERVDDPAAKRWLRLWLETAVQQIEAHQTEPVQA